MMGQPLPPETVEQYQALTTSVGVVADWPQSRVQLLGADRATLLHNFCTNDIQRLTPGEGTEAFVTNARGKIVGHVLVFCDSDGLWLQTTEGQAEALVTHLDRYVLREDVTFQDRSAEGSRALIAGAQAARALEDSCGWSPPAEPLQHGCYSVDNQPLWLGRLPWPCQPTWLVQGSESAVASFRDRLSAAGAMLCGVAAAEILRVESGWPNYGQDISEDNLPQEVARNHAAISFTKGCYLGQETVARIDALGHVNKTLQGVRFDAESQPTAGQTLSSQGQEVGKLTSVVFSPRLNAPLAMAYLRRGNDLAETPLESDAGRAEVISLPLAVE